MCGQKNKKWCHEGWEWFKNVQGSTTGANEKNQQTWMKYNCMKIVDRLMEMKFNISRTMVRHFNSFFLVSYILKSKK